MPTTVKLASHLFLGKSLGSKGEPATATLLSQDNFYCVLSTYLSFFYTQMYFSLLINEATPKTTAGPNAENNERWHTTTADTSTT